MNFRVNEEMISRTTLEGALDGKRPIIRHVNGEPDLKIGLRDLVMAAGIIRSSGKEEGSNLCHKNTPCAPKAESIDFA